METLAQSTDLNYPQADPAMQTVQPMETDKIPSNPVQPESVGPQSGKHEEFSVENEDNTWEPEDNLDCPDLISAYEEARLKREREAAPQPEVEEGHTTRKRAKRGDKKKKVEEIEKPRGLARGLQPEKILAGQLFHGTLHFLVKWQDCSEMDVVPGHDLGEAFPDFVISYYEKCAPFSVRHSVGRVARPAPELPPLNGSQNKEAPMEVTQDAPAAERTDAQIPTEEQPVLQTPEDQPIEVPVN